MLEYKDINFYNDYCSRLEDFTMLEYFEPENGYFIGKISPNDTLYYIEIILKIPQSFPYNKMFFYTQSLSGYPHLINSTSGYGNWFCLNTPFAETAEQQLNEEFYRLRGWLKKQLRPELPQHIPDPMAQRALRIFNLYDGGNQDEINEITNTGAFTFIGDFGSHIDNFNSHEGFLHAVCNYNSKGYESFTIFEDKHGTNMELPYVIVNHFPKNINSFQSLIDEFKWSKELCEKLLPGFFSSYAEMTSFALPDDQQLTKFQKLLKEQYEQEFAYANIPKQHKVLIKKNIDELQQFFTKYLGNFQQSNIDEEPDGWDIAQDLYAEHEKDYNKLHYFALGINLNKKLLWFLIYTNKITRKIRKMKYLLAEVISLNIYDIEDVVLGGYKATTILPENYFGRGALYKDLITKRIAIIGVGAIGSSLAEALVRGGVRNLTLWDSDTVEPGNLCRSTYNTTNIGDTKARALANNLNKVSPFCRVNIMRDNFYGNINYDNQSKFIESLKNYDILIDCTASNELLYFLSYAAKDIPVVSLCITNLSRDLLCISNHKGSNPFEMRKHLLANIEQETGSYYEEKTGCYSPTFLASNCDIQSLVQLCVRTINRNIQKYGYVDTIVWHYQEDSIIADHIKHYKIDNGGIKMIVLNSIISKIDSLPVLENGEIAYLLGGYSREHDSIFITDAVSIINTKDCMEKIMIQSQGIIDFIGLACVKFKGNTIKEEAIKKFISSLAKDTTINANNPIMAIVDADGNTAFNIYINNQFVAFHSQN